MACWVFAVQVVSAGALGIFGRNGWFCSEADVERWSMLMGWRGLKDNEVRQYFNNTIIDFYAEWG